jgi:hypothetical protein
MEWVQTALGVILGGIITFLASYFFYKRAGDELRLEANRLREEASEINRLTNIILRGLHNYGILEVKWEDGKVVGLFVNLKGRVEIKTSISDVNLSLRKVNDNQKNKIKD